MRPAFSVFSLCLLVSGCSTGGSGARWYAPATWFSHQPADAVDRAGTKEEAARHDAVKAAQRTAHQAGTALASAPPSRAVAVAADLNASTTALLDQAEGPLGAGESARLRATATGLLSENAELRAEAEAQREEERRGIARVGEALARAEEKSEAASKKLRDAFDRENLLANELRAQRALFWIAVGVAVLLGLGWLYVRFALGGVPIAIGRALGDLRQRNPALAEQITPLFDQYLNRHEQALVARNAR